MVRLTGYCALLLLSGCVCQGGVRPLWSDPASMLVENPDGLMLQLNCGEF